MNDFTKEELMELLAGYQLHQHNSRHNWPSLDLCNKLQSLIDNYCEQERCQNPNCKLSLHPSNVARIK